MEKLIDSFGRHFRYLRLSVTDKCNFRCIYCLPDGYQAPEGPTESELTVAEIRSLCEGFSRLGFEKIRLTGGEPTTRKDLLEIAQAISSLSGIRTVALSTNGHNLDRLARPLQQAGVRALNVSLDSLSHERFRAITGSGRFDSVLKGIETAVDCGFSSVKVNVVLLRGFADLDLPGFFEWVKRTPVTVRFIELMRTGRNGSLFSSHHLGSGEIQLLLRKQGWAPLERANTAGPALEYSHPDYQGNIGIIAPYSNEFCDGCNRLRVSSRGSLRLCLFGEQDYSLRPLLASAKGPELVAAALKALIIRKPAAHSLHEGKYGNTWNLASIGG